MSNKKLILLLGIIGLLLRVVEFEAQASPVLSIDSANLHYAEGYPISVDVRIADITDLYALQFDVVFNPAVLSVTDITEGSFMTTGGATLFIPGVIDNAVGTITLTIDSLIGATGGVNGSGTLATINFSTNSRGISPITLANALLLDSSLSDISFATTGVILSVPEPTTEVLFLIGLISLVILKPNSAQTVKPSRLD